MGFFGGEERGGEIFYVILYNRRIIIIIINEEIIINVSQSNYHVKETIYVFSYVFLMKNQKLMK